MTKCYVVLVRRQLWCKSSPSDATISCRRFARRRLRSLELLPSLHARDSETYRRRVCETVRFAIVERARQRDLPLFSQPATATSSLLPPSRVSAACCCRSLSLVARAADFWDRSVEKYFELLTSIATEKVWTERVVWGF
ncbi:unnamed protein product [Citrullus colocynthis]|uniref:Uncharacterized protein n=1 Tax=Citrullus colocynthis TaxID=252529 RepID=A0ABP0YBR0_9ROSI